jgi:hypothetical protein
MRRPSKQPFGSVWWVVFAMVVSLGIAPALYAAEIVIYGFEGSAEGWVIPDWAKSSADYVVSELAISSAYAKEGNQSLVLETAFPGQRWSGAYVEREVEVTDWGTFRRLSVSAYLPADAPEGLRGRIILTVGDQWQWTEMNRAIALVPGQWTEIGANLAPGSMDWRFFPTDGFRKDVRKLGVRIESDKQPAYLGWVFLDDVRLSE